MLKISRESWKTPRVANSGVTGAWELTYNFFEKEDLIFYKKPDKVWFEFDFWANSSWGWFDPRLWMYWRWDYQTNQMRPHQVNFWKINFKNRPFFRYCKLNGRYLKIGERDVMESDTQTQECTCIEAGRTSCVIEAKPLKALQIQDVRKFENKLF